MPHHNPENKNFKLLAVRVLPECASWVMKCLAENIFYYLNNDYRISDDGTSIKRRSEFSAPISDDFFQVGEQGTPRINISAIVGKNGDGKSTLVEIIIRLLNNFALEMKFGEGRLKKANGLCAELYYQMNDRFYKLEEKSSATNLYSYEHGEDGQYALLPQALDEDEIKGSFFYTLVSNYSHYAYNTLEVDREEGYGNDEEHWLHNVFHKNDGYQVPLSIHPYRKEGIIDLNNETWLSKQRVLMTFVQSYLKNEEGNAMQFNGKNAVELVLSDTKSSKLQQVTLRHFFQAKSGVNLLDEVNDLYGLGKSDGSINRYCKKLEKVANALSTAFLEIINPNLLFYKNAIKWIENERLFDKRSDLHGLISFLKENSRNQPLASSRFIEVKRKVDNVTDQWSDFERLSWMQLQRLALLNKICHLWSKEGLHIDENTIITFNLSPNSIFKDYAKLTDDEKCCHYLVYKTISIFETYDSYGMPCDQYVNQALFINGKNPQWPGYINQYTSGTFAFQRLAEDWREQSHVTLKLRQAYNYYIDKNDRTKSTYKTTEGVDVPSDGKVHIMFGRLNEFQKKTLTCLETLPPSIYNWDIIFCSSYDNGPIAMESFSSGEKQKLYCQSAVVYHLQNISSISCRFPIQYRSVNFILEEIELYFHPDWQRTFCYELMEMIRTASIKNIESVNITFVTHSPYILSDIPKTNVLFLKEGRPDYSMQENTFGANINTLLKNGFFLPGLPIGKFARRKIDDMFGKLQSGEFNKGRIDEFQSEVMMVGEPYIRQQLMSLIKMRPEAQADVSSLIQYVQSLQSELRAMHYRIEEIEKVQNRLSNRDLNKLTYD